MNGDKLLDDDSAGKTSLKLIIEILKILCEIVAISSSGSDFIYWILFT